MKTNLQPAEKIAFDIDSNNPTFEFNGKSFTLPRLDKVFFSQGVFDNVRFSRAFTQQNIHHIISKSALSAAVGYHAVRYFP